MIVPNRFKMNIDGLMVKPDSRQPHRFEKHFEDLLLRWIYHLCKPSDWRCWKHLRKSKSGWDLWPFCMPVYHKIGISNKNTATIATMIRELFVCTRHLELPQAIPMWDFPIPEILENVRPLPFCDSHFGHLSTSAKPLKSASFQAESSCPTSPRVDVVQWSFLEFFLIPDRSLWLWYLDLTFRKNLGLRESMIIPTTW